MATADQPLEALKELEAIGILGQKIVTQDPNEHRWPVPDPSLLAPGWLRHMYDQYGEIRWYEQ